MMMTDGHYYCTVSTGPTIRKLSVLLRGMFHAMQNIFYLLLLLESMSLELLCAIKEERQNMF